MTDILRTKSELRSILQQRRSTLSPAAQHSAALALLHSVDSLPIWANARRIALYLAANGEIGTSPLEKMARDMGKQLFLPVIGTDNNLSFALWQAGEPLAKNRYGIPEPIATAPRCAVTELDVIFLPLVGWDLRGGRLGMGGGFYDRTLAGVCGPVLVGLAHDNQRVEDVPQANWDIRLDYIATDVALYQRQVKQGLE